MENNIILAALGIISLVITAVLVPIVRAFIGEMKASREDREKGAKAAAEERSLDRDERRQMRTEWKDSVGAHMDKNTQALTNICTIIEHCKDKGAF